MQNLLKTAHTIKQQFFADKPATVEQFWQTGTAFYDSNASRLQAFADEVKQAGVPPLNFDCDFADLWHDNFVDTLEFGDYESIDNLAVLHSGLDIDDLDQSELLNLIDYNHDFFDDLVTLFKEQNLVTLNRLEKTLDDWLEEMES